MSLWRRVPALRLVAAGLVTAAVAVLAGRALFSAASPPSPPASVISAAAWSPSSPSPATTTRFVLRGRLAHIDRSQLAGRPRSAPAAVLAPDDSLRTLLPFSRFDFGACPHFWPHHPGTWSSSGLPVHLQSLLLPPRAGLVEATHHLYLLVALVLRDAGIAHVLARSTLLAAVRHFAPVPWDPRADLWVQGTAGSALQAALRRLVDHAGARLALNTPHTVIVAAAAAATDAIVVLHLYDRNATHLALRRPQSLFERAVPVASVFPVRRRPYGCALVAPAPLAAPAVLAAHYNGDLSLCARAGVAAPGAKAEAGDAPAPRRTVFPCAAIVDVVPWVVHARASPAGAPVERLRYPAAATAAGLPMPMPYAPGDVWAVPATLHLFTPGRILLPAALRACYVHNPRWQVRMWTTTNLPFAPLSLPAFRGNNASAAAAAAGKDPWATGSLLLLLELLRVYGGVAVTGAYTCAGPLPPVAVLQGGFTALALADAAGAVVAAPPHHAHVHKLLSELGPEPTPAALARFPRALQETPDWLPSDPLRGAFAVDHTLYSAAGGAP